MTKTIVTLNLAEELLERAVAEKGEGYEYPDWASGCYYERDDAPSCIVGHVFNYLGLTPEQLGQLDAPNKHFSDANGQPVSRNNVVSALVPLVAEAFDIELTEPAAVLLREAQLQQDNGSPWGLAAQRAKAAVAGYNV